MLTSARLYLFYTHKALTRLSTRSYTCADTHQHRPPIRTAATPLTRLPPAHIHIAHQPASGVAPPRPPQKRHSASTPRTRCPGPPPSPAMSWCRRACGPAWWAMSLQALGPALPPGRQQPLPHRGALDHACRQCLPARRPAGAHPALARGPCTSTTRRGRWRRQALRRPAWLAALVRPRAWSVQVAAGGLAPLLGLPAPAHLPAHQEAHEAVRHTPQGPQHRESTCSPRLATCSWRAATPTTVRVAPRPRPQRQESDGVGWGPSRLAAAPRPSRLAPLL